MRALLLASCGAIAAPGIAQQGEELFFEDFEAGLENWEVSNAQAIRVVDSGDAERGRVLELAPHDARLCALIRGSDAWAGYRIEGFFRFPDASHNYLGLIYNYVERDGRVDLGSIYVKGNGSYIRVNPRRDWNPARSLYEEWRVDLTGDGAIRIGSWHYFAAEVLGNVCHFYVGDAREPKVTFDLYELDRGKAGFKPRVVGGAVWIDNVLVTELERLSYDGQRLPTGLDYRPEDMVTDWRVLGPLQRTHAEVEAAGTTPTEPVREGTAQYEWHDFDTDVRGAVVTGRVVDFLGSRTVAYFSTTIEVEEGQRTELHVSTIDDLAVWVNGHFEGYYDRERYAWYDLGRNPDHPLEPYPLVLLPGENHVLFRVRGGVYASGGFYVRKVTH